MEGEDRGRVGEKNVTMIERVAWAMSKRGDEYARGLVTWHDLARAALEEMKEPTNEMMAAGWGVDVTPRNVWKTMIDAALSEKE